mmetsp:Transcript_16431/g.40625  ORF Transcript_16431/g.40625 Transcript_16431/m.40625 type:complete len:1263 (-) Transcript_16431:928-4716(-)|eukprot:CAMPEP_0178992120 /NCGR_PEP_ID=MMETSP0795-20121207/5925_1 /TAXON_ID=88552 /ORGANISM="Amoebophrya sp., Strain Ameob2" /LENGTH=1262 /DNA_ID=CAMNT_0020683941 /DNA_START=324 /DNA_END=4112 /DNA_ORIENTATION=+
MTESEAEVDAVPPPPEKRTNSTTAEIPLDFACALIAGDKSELFARATFRDCATLSDASSFGASDSTQALVSVVAARIKEDTQTAEASCTTDGDKADAAVASKDEGGEAPEIDAALARLGSVGLNRIPAWLRPVGALSNGERCRALLAVQLQTKMIVENFSATVDEQNAKSMAYGLRKLLRANKVRQVVVAVSDGNRMRAIAPFLQPDFCVILQEGGASSPRVVLNPNVAPPKMSRTNELEHRAGNAAATAAAKSDRLRFSFDLSGLEKLETNGPGGWHGPQDPERGKAFEPPPNRVYCRRFPKSVAQTKLRNRVFADCATAAATTAFELGPSLCPEDPTKIETITNIFSFNLGSSAGSAKWLSDYWRLTGIGGILGPSGSGKTTAVRKLMKDLEKGKSLWDLSQAEVADKKLAEAGTNVLVGTLLGQEKQVVGGDGDGATAAAGDGKLNSLLEVLDLQPAVLRVPLSALSAGDRECVRIAVALQPFLSLSSASTSSSSASSSAAAETPSCSGEGAPPTSSEENGQRQERLRVAVIDEFTSLLARERASRICRRLASSVRCESSAGLFDKKLRLLVVGVHEDVIEWLAPGFVLHSKKGHFTILQKTTETGAQKGAAEAVGAAGPFAQSEKKTHHSHGLAGAPAKTAQKIGAKPDYKTKLTTPSLVDGIDTKMKKTQTPGKTPIISQASGQKSVSLLNFGVRGNARSAAKQAVAPQRPQKDALQLRRDLAPGVPPAASPSARPQVDVVDLVDGDDAAAPTLNSPSVSEPQQEQALQNSACSSKPRPSPEQDSLFAIPHLEFVIRQLDANKMRTVWYDSFAEHHYLTSDVPHTIQACIVREKATNRVAGFYGASIFPGAYNGGITFRECRMVLLPEFQGLGIGPRLSNAMAQHYLDQGKRFCAHTGHPRLGPMRDLDPLWKASLTSGKPDTTGGNGGMFANKKNQATDTPFPSRRNKTPGSMKVQSSRGKKNVAGPLSAGPGALQQEKMSAEKILGRICEDGDIVMEENSDAEVDHGNEADEDEADEGEHAHILYAHKFLGRQGDGNDSLLPPPMKRKTKMRLKEKVKGEEQEDGVVGKVDLLDFFFNKNEQKGCSGDAAVEPPAMEAKEQGGAPVASAAGCGVVAGRSVLTGASPVFNTPVDEKQPAALPAPKRKRGRPPKNAVAPGGAALDETKASSDAAGAGVVAPKMKRGRPPKVVVKTADDDLEEAAAAPAPKKRGRPPKVGKTEQEDGVGEMKSAAAPPPQKKAKGRSPKAANEANLPE